MIRSFVIAILLLGALVAPNDLWAHEQRAALTSVLFNDRTGNIEIVHRFYIHDAEHAVRQVIDDNADILASDKTQLAFTNYVVDNFKLAGADGQLLDIHTLGYEVEGRYFWIYQELPIQEFDVMNVVNNALREIWPQQTNTVNIEGRGTVKTLTFEGSVDILSVDF